MFLTSPGEKSHLSAKRALEYGKKSFCCHSGSCVELRAFGAIAYRRDQLERDLNIIYVRWVAKEGHFSCKVLGMSLRRGIVVVGFDKKRRGDVSGLVISIKMAI